MIPLYGLVRVVMRTPARERIKEAAGSLLFLSNSLHKGHDGDKNYEAAKSAFGALGGALSPSPFDVPLPSNSGS